jgi:protein-S-isoprenylcysteine O-methyltransferase Ste14
VTPAPRGARVRVPPPLIFLAGWLAGWVLHRRLPFDIDGGGAGRTQVVLGALLIPGGLLLMGWAITTLLRSRTTLLPHGVVRQVVTAGPYRLSRNPIYLADAAIYVGAALLFNYAWPLLLLPLVLTVLTSVVVSREEQYLRETFGDVYDAYARRVRRWI